MTAVAGDEETLKQQVRDFWNAESCGERYAIGPDMAAALAEQASRRYQLEPYLRPFARFHEGAGKDVLEIGVGMGADHLEWASASPRTLTGVDLTPRAVSFTSARLEAAGRHSNLRVADAEQLPFDDASFDIVYSWGVLHHSPNTALAIREVHRVLRPGGTARIMIYHSPSVVGAMLWLRYGLMRLQPFTSGAEIYAKYLESPGTKAYSRAAASALFTTFSSVKMTTELSTADLLLEGAGKRHQGRLLNLASVVWPRMVLRRLAKGWGLHLLIEARK
jgi:ubiquinone/menaquinone biosynthesis C-methylase UbiE